MCYYLFRVHIPNFRFKKLPLCAVNLNALALKMKKLSKYLDPLPYLPFLFAAMFIVIGCRDTDKTVQAISEMEVDLEIVRFDREFMKTAPEQIPAIKSKYPYLFPSQFSDSTWIAKLKDTIQIELSGEVEKTFGDFRAEADGLRSLFKHIAYYFPQVQIPKVVTLISDVRYDRRVILTDTLLLLGLDNYLGPNHRFYTGIPRYIAITLDGQYLIPDVAGAFSKTVLEYPKDRTFLSKVIYYGKELYVKDKLLPSSSDAQKIGYSQDQMDWAVANEEQIWRYFVERELLYSTASDLDRRFLDPAPFSKFQLQLDNESPGRLGRYLGWQVVKAFMQKNRDVGFKQLLKMPADEIFVKSKYKPKR